MGANGLFLSEPFDLLLGIAYAFFAMMIFQKLHRDSILLDRLAAVGRMSLTNYLMTSVILAFLFVSWGLGWFGTVDRLQALALAIVPMILIWSRPWLEHFRYGPFEWLWRVLSTGEAPPFRERRYE